METIDISLPFKQLGLSFLLGLLVGLQRERAHSRIGGLRTFVFVTTFGTMCAFLSQIHSPWILAAGFIALSCCLVIANVVELRITEPAPGITTEVAMLVMFAVGAYIPSGSLSVAVAVGVSTAAVLQFKPALHGFARNFGDNELSGLMKLVIVWFIVLPVLPDKGYGPFHAINPHEIWLMVVIVTAVGTTGYACYRLFGKRAGMLLAGILGGAISSTATTLNYARHSSADEGAARHASVVILIATTIVYLRLAVEIAAVSRELLRAAWLPLAFVASVSLSCSIIAWKWSGGTKSEDAGLKNPPSLKGALAFGLLYAVVLLAAAAAQAKFGNRGLAAVAAVSGLTDMDAITLSVAQMVNSGRLDAAEAWPLVLLASASNLVFKFGIVVWFGNRTLRQRIAWLYGLSMVPIAGLLAFAWG